MRAFENVAITKPEFVAELKWHQEQDLFLKGTYDNGHGKGCAVGCSLMSVARAKKIEIADFSNHARYEDLLGVPEWLARVEDTIFEGLPTDRSKTWPVEFAEAINVGADLERAKAPFLIFILESNLERIQSEKYKQQREAVEG
jgi:hypothetical protein